MSNITLKDIFDEIGELRKEIRATYVTKDEFKPVKSIAYGIVALILTTVLAAFLAQVIKAF